jgi:isoquinoline 1-oxidoreductase alpha subunit
MTTLNVNGKVHSVDVEPDTPLLWVLREQLGLTGTKYGCGVAQCGACTVLIDGVPTRTCLRPVSTVKASEKVVTIEGLSPQGSHPLQKAWIALDVPQCGFCQSGMIMAAAALLADKPHPTDAEIDAAMTNICRCGTYNRVRAAIKVAAQGEMPSAPAFRFNTATGARHEREPLAATISRYICRRGGLVVGFHVPFAGAAASQGPPHPRSTPGSSSNRTIRWSSESRAPRWGRER